ncbi:polysaccharide pyruvyl transferase family protein [Pseudomonas putida]|uniref:polysaccharide pyruvyl transferase family protein n=1 Tax=Pseudomonas putida TaxID=303 RepID=UPI002D1E76EB|nr:polysaccharide pyruvyl transferase family protein [Pseudomonas putida]MEB3901401.1 polysaccharide pyruvyl transferase family protein [Pseudomonas putida]
MKALEYLKDYFGINKDIRVINFPITDNCNSRCTMCNIWKNNVTNEITPDEISKVLEGPEFHKVKHLGISGGEPTLRKDLVRCIEAIVNALPELETLSITSHGYSSSRWRRFLPLIKALLNERKIDFSLNISIDGYSGRHDLIRGIDGAFSKAEKTIQIAQELGVRLQFQYTISTMNVYSMQMALSYARSKDIEIIFRLATNIERLYNLDRSEVFVNSEERSFVADFFTSEELINQTRSLSRKMYYDRMQRWLVGRGNDRQMPCYFKAQGLLLTSKLDVYPCSVTTEAAAIDLRSNGYKLSGAKIDEARRKTQANFCSTCIHDQSGAWSPYDILKYKFRTTKTYKILNKISRLSGNLLQALLINGKWAAATNENKGKERITIPTAVVIGAYGGEHVGDAAILGGVILRLKKEYLTTKVKILSFRPERTTKWVRSLRIEGVEFEVVELSRKRLKDFLLHSDGLVYAGGPIMDIPVNLSFYLYASLMARKLKRPFIIEGVGLGPYKRAISKYLSSMVLLNASRVTLRSANNLSTLPFSDKIKIHEIGRDPAFDYLDYTKNLVGSLTYSARDRLEITSLDSYVSGRENVLYVNLRPIWSAYASKGSESSVAGVVDQAVLNITSFLNSLNSDWGVVFIPFNPDTYGFSDFSSFYDVIKGLNSDRDYYLVEYEPGVPLMLEMLERCSHLLAMRFHACIFGISMNKKVYGIDYQVGGKGKVAGLFQSLSDKNYSNICSLSKTDLTSWIEKK